MKLFCAVIFLLSLAPAAFAREESILARVTSYWADEGSKYASTGRRLRPGHCAVPKRITYGNKVVFPDAVCTAVETGMAVISRSRSSMWTHCKPTQGHRGRPIFRNQAKSGRVVECAFRIHDASGYSTWICLRTD
jgi:hypothetical protein